MFSASSGVILCNLMFLVGYIDEFSIYALKIAKEWSGM